MTDPAAYSIDQLQAKIQALEAQLVDCQTEIDRLTASEAKFRAIAEHASDTICTIDQADRIAYLSPNVQETLGYRPAALGHPLEVLIHPEDWPDCASILQQVRATAQPYLGLEYRMRHQQGHYVWQRANLSVYPDEAGRPMLIAIGRDVTQQKQTEAELRASDARFNEILSGVLASIDRYRINRDNTWALEYCSPGSIHVWGFPPEALLADPYLLSSRVHPDDLEPVINGQFFSIVRAGETGKIEYRHAHPRLGWRWIAVTVSSVWDEAANCWLVTTVATDISERKQIEEALRISEARLNRILDRTLACIGDYRVYRDRRFVADYFSSGSLQLWGFPPEDLLVDIQLYLSRYEPEDLQAILASAYDYIFDERPYKYEYRYHHPDGSLRWIELNLNSYRDPAEDCWRTTVVSIDITDRKRAEAALRQSETQLNEILDRTSAAIANYRVYRDRRFIPDYFSSGSRQLWGFPPDALLSDPLLSFSRLEPTDRQNILDEEYDYIFNERPYQYEYRYHHPDGSLRWIQFYLTAYRDEPEDCWRVTTISINVTDRKRAEEALARSEARFRRIVENATDLIGTVDATGIFTYLSPNARDLLGYEATDLVGNSFEPLIHPDDLPLCYAAFQQGLSTGRAEIPDYRMAHRDGSIRYFTTTVSGFEDENGNPIVLGITRDITDRRRLQEELRQSQQFLNSVIENIPLGFFAKDVRNEFRYVLINKCAERFVCFSREQGLGHHDHELLPQSQADFYRQQDQAVAQQRSLIEAPEVEITTVSGERLLARILKFPLFDDQGTLTHLLCLTDDITELKQRQEELRQAKNAAEAANRAKSVFLANMSHELRTPLNVILGFTQLMERENDLSDRQREFITTINRSGEHLLNLINDVLEMSKIEAGRITLNPEPFDLRYLLETLQDMFLVRAEAKRLSLTCQLPPDLPETIVADEGKLRQVLINLLSNAVKFTLQGGITLQVELEQAELEQVGLEQAELNPAPADRADGNPPEPHRDAPERLLALRFTIADTGIGIAPEEMEQLFQPFVQTMSGMQIKEGTGLGLTISRQFVQLMGGDIQLQSVVGQGSRFSFQIPVTGSYALLSSPSRPARQVLGLAPGQPTYRLLIVDDRVDNCLLLTHLLQSLGFETRTAHNGQEAIDCWRHWHPHLIWMDMRMPIMDGYEATRRIRALERAGRQESRQEDPLCAAALHSPTKIIALTASAFEEQRTTVLAAGCDDFVRKPFRERVIFEKLTEHLGVVFLDAERSTAPAIEAATVSDLKAQWNEVMLLMPKDWIQDLQQAAIEIDADRLLQLIAEMPPSQAQLAAQMRQLVQRFCFDEILELIAGDADE